MKFELYKGSINKKADINRKMGTTTSTPVSSYEVRRDFKRECSKICQFSRSKSKKEDYVYGKEAAYFLAKTFEPEEGCNTCNSCKSPQGLQIKCIISTEFEAHITKFYCIMRCERCGFETEETLLVEY